MAIEVEQKAERRGSLVKYSLYIGVTLLLIMAAGYAFLYFSVNSSEQELADLKKQAERQMSEEDKKLQRRITRTQRAFERSSRIIDSHRSVYNFLTTLASTTHPHLRFNQMDFDADLGKAQLKGITRDFATLGEQVKVLQKKDSIENVEIRGAYVETGAKVGFEIILTLNPEIFNFPPNNH